MSNGFEIISIANNIAIRNVAMTDFGQEIGKHFERLGNVKDKAIEAIEGMEATRKAKSEAKAIVRSLTKNDLEKGSFRLMIQTISSVMTNR